jgi:hypothetical protein
VPIQVEYIRQHGRVPGIPFDALVGEQVDTVLFARDYSTVRIGFG